MPDEIGTTSAEVSTTSTPAESSTGSEQTYSPGQAPSVDGSQAPAAGSAAVVPPAAGTTVPPVYTPNLKFKVMDKELEIDPLFHALVKDAETEKKIREMHEKAFGLDSVKTDRQMLKQKIDTHYAPLEQKFQETTRSLAVIDKMVEKGDYDNFFKVLEIPEQKILEWAVKKAQLMQLTPAEQAAYNQQVQDRNNLYLTEQQNVQYQEQLFQHQVQARTFELDQELSKPEVLKVVEAFDSQAGTPGALKAEIIKRGQFYAYQGVDKPVADVVKEILGFVGHVVPQAQPGAQQPGVGSAQPAGQSTQQAAPTVKPPVIPNVGGQGTSPAKKKVRSLDDLRELSKQQTN
jgi:hypothetical protein